ncbi:MAG: DsrE family protein [Thiotrichales bacterium]
MKLGVVVTDEAFARQAVGLIDAATTRGWETRCFLTDSGVRLLQDPSFERVCLSRRSEIALCEMSAERFHMEAPSRRLEEHGVVVGGQYQNAELVAHCDQVIVL